MIDHSPSDSPLASDAAERAHTSGAHDGVKGAHGLHMLARERHQHILDSLRDHGAVSVAEICSFCGVSAVTVRSDLSHLEDEGLLKRTRGGAVPAHKYVVPVVSKRLHKNPQSKHAIAAAGARLVRDGEMILVGSGSTTLAFVKELRGKEDLTIVTNSCHIIDYASCHMPNTTIISTGGQLERAWGHYTGSILAASLSDVYVDHVFLGADGFEPSFGFLAEYEATARAKVEFMKHARSTIMLVDSSKIGANRLFLRFAKPNDVDCVIMDRDPEGIVSTACSKGPRSVEIIEALL